ncbi:MAG: cytochrome c oxidase subunit II [Anaerolineales bacterium]|nr:cytochrome c oxidase subunit II [Anaerolineales bacterium]NUQ83899.1 cytochrome c oxidase subunit II [Anaerolineales bacterium]
MRHFVVVGILVVAVAVLTYLGLHTVGLMPVPASAQAGPIDWLWDLQIKAMTFLFALIVVPMVYSLFVFRRRKGDTSDAEHIEGNTTLEIVWTIIPLFMVLGMAYIGAENLAETRRVDPDAMVVRVTGYQWGWTFDYPDYGITSNELYLPVNRQALLKMESRDVIHSFWVPEFRVKQDLVPGRVTELRITPTLIGDTYKVRCAEICGTSHAYMEAPVIVVEKVAFEAWVAEQQALASEAGQTPEGRGLALVTANGCRACHSIDGSGGVGPTWFQLAGSEVPLSGGGTVVADDAFLKESILQPQAKIVAGFEAQQMPAYNFTDEQVADIIAYIKTLK